MTEELETKDMPIEEIYSPEYGLAPVQISDIEVQQIEQAGNENTRLLADIDTEPQQVFARTNYERLIDYETFERIMLHRISNIVVRRLELNDLRDFGVKEEMLPIYFSNWKYKMIIDTLIYNCNINDVIFTLVVQNADSGSNFFIHLNHFLRSNSLLNLYNTIPNTSLETSKFHSELVKRLRKIRNSRLNLNSL